MLMSRTMLPEDYSELQKEIGYNAGVQSRIGPRDWRQHKHRDWEEAMALKALKEFHSIKMHGPMAAMTNMVPLFVADFGCGAGLLPAILLAYGCDITMYEVWSMGNVADKAQCLRQADKIGHMYTLIDGIGLGTLPERHYGKYDAAFSISVIEHIEDEEAALEDLVNCLKPTGLIFLTMDYADRDEDDYELNHLRVRIYNQEKMERIAYKLRGYGFEHLSTSDEPKDLNAWMSEGDWPEMVNNYTFASLAMIRREG